MVPIQNAPFAEETGVPTDGSMSMGWMSGIPQTPTEHDRDPLLRCSSSIEPRSTHALVLLPLLFLRRRVSRQRNPPLRLRNLRPPFPVALRQASGERPLVLHRQCPLGILQSHRGLHAHPSRRQLQPSRHPAGGHARRRHAAHGRNGGPQLRPLPRRNAVTPPESSPLPASI